ncbi:SDR family oxidoreductase [Alienimonas californiensis]|uniref:3 beta-hydroxysteroid dehydrogenase/Delta 5-->4-isomerase n=1 Tax=Alienimonas californiensis TaxID=2527989 RepID=A0A517P3J5_9PLAN|nr:SDR family oxidoreductase [Alienimonas californiensis]QDT13950.1 3 beta-hydroxysteroid dehydrogenase/Delta 5-->4-isomerase [Alienimonas californiensis]
MSQTRLILGCGYLGRRVAVRWQEAGHRVVCLTRSPETAAEFKRRGWEAVVGDVTDAASLEALPTPDVVLHAVGYDRSSDRSREEVAALGTENAWNSPAGGARRYIYISTTGVYGQTDGEWIDEESPTEPDSDGGRANLAAEQVVRSRFGGRSGVGVVLRPSGIYGPGRVMRSAEQVRAGEPVRGRAEAWLNLVHVDDLASAVCLAADAAEPDDLYLVSDDRPLTRQEYYGLLAERFGGPPPTFTGAGGRVEGLGKRCRSDRIRADLGWAPRFPTAAEGLADALRSPESR